MCNTPGPGSRRQIRTRFQDETKPLVFWNDDWRVLKTLETSLRDYEETTLEDLKRQLPNLEVFEAAG